MKTRITCPYCEKRTVEAATKAWFIYGFLLFARFGSKTFVGCRICVKEKVWESFGLSLLGGWWCFPWGLGTPFVLLQNLFSAISPDEYLLREVLTKAGLDPEEVMLGEDGLSGEQRRMIKLAYCVLAQAVYADGHADDREIGRVSEIIGSLTGKSPTRAELLRNLQEGLKGSLSFQRESLEFRNTLFRMAADIAFADGVFDTKELEFLLNVGHRLNIDPALVREILEVFYGDGDEVEHGSEFDEDLIRACKILGVQADTPFMEVRKRYRMLMMKYHPDRVAHNGQSHEDALRVSQEVTWAYQHYSRTLGRAESV